MGAAAAGGGVDLGPGESADPGADDGVEELAVSPFCEGLGGGETVCGGVGGCQGRLAYPGEEAGGAGVGDGAVVGGLMVVAAAGMDVVAVAVV